MTDAANSEDNCDAVGLLQLRIHRRIADHAVKPASDSGAAVSAGNSVGTKRVERGTIMYSANPPSRPRPPPICNVPPDRSPSIRAKQYSRSTFIAVATAATTPER